jgi:hypothetical protein
MLERGLKFTERRSLTSERRLITPLFSRGFICRKPDEAGTKAVDFCRGITNA